MNLTNQTKQCTKCKECFPSTTVFFYSQKISSKKNGVYSKLTPWCKNCLKTKQMKYKREHIEECREKNLQYYYDNPQRNKDVRLRNKKYFKENREVHAERLSRWQKANPDRVREYNRYREMHKNHDITDDEWNNCKNYFNFRCAYCDLPIENHYIKRKDKYIWSDFHKEHFEHDGANDITNLIPSCLWCNTSKNRRKYVDWYNESRESFSTERHRKIIKWIYEDHKKYMMIEQIQ